MVRILFVDDEPNLLQGLQRMLRPMRNEWLMTFTNGGEEALQALATADYTVLVTDMRMPGMDGAQLLEKVKALYPGVARIVLSGQTELEDVLKATGTAHQFIAKPCEATHLKNAVEGACRIRALLANEKIIKIIGDISALPSLPTVYRELTEEMTRNSGESSLKRISQIITHDVALSAKVLQIANSAFFGIPRTVETAQQAVMILGANVIRSIVVVDAVFNSFKLGKNVGMIDVLQQHSLAVSSAAHALAKSEGADNHVQDQSLQAGALHDIGKLILAARAPDIYRQIEEIVCETGKPQHQVEMEVLGCDHGQIGAYLLGLWGLPNGIVEAVAYHHCPEKLASHDGDFSPLTAVYAANLYLQGTLPILKTQLVDSLKQSLGQPERFKHFDNWLTTVANSVSH